MLQVVGWNACSLRHKLPDLTVFVSSCLADIIFVFEPWFDQFSSVSLLGFTSYAYRNRNHHSGILILVRSSIIHSMVSLVPSFSLFVCFIQTHVKKIYWISG